ncbi:MAG: hypothetical protein Q8M03_03620 [Legionella sp.]|nr:hypothetical protein [Legionella sp.]
MFSCGNLNLELTLHELRWPQADIKVIFIAENVNSVIRAFSLIKDKDKYIIEFNVDSRTDLTKVGEVKNDEPLQHSPGVRYFYGGTLSCFKVSIQIKEGHFQELSKIFDVATLLDDVDPAFINFIEQVISCESSYRNDMSNENRFDDLLMNEPKKGKGRYRMWDSSFTEGLSMDSLSGDDPNWPSHW